MTCTLGMSLCYPGTFFTGRGASGVGRWVPRAWPDAEVWLAVPNDFPVTSPNVYLCESIQTGVLPEQTTMK